MKFNKKELFTIPNILSYFRILLIPFFCYFILRNESTTDSYIAIAIVGLSGLSDMFDGMLARKLNQISEFGKLLDPVADKLTLTALFICLSLNNILLFPVLLLMVIKEAFMFFVGLALLKHNNRKLDGALIYGKVCTFMLYVVVAIFLFFPTLNTMISYSVIGAITLLLLFTLLMYLKEFHRLWLLPKVN